MKLEDDDITQICKRVVDQDLDTQFVANQFESSRRRVQQLAKAYRESREIPSLDTPGRKPYTEYPTYLEEWILELYQSLDPGAGGVSHVLQVRDGISIDTNRVHDILKEYEHVREKYPRNRAVNGRWPVSNGTTPVSPSTGIGNRTAAANTYSAWKTTPHASSSV